MQTEGVSCSRTFHKDLAWLAGLLEGEGCFRLRPDSSRKKWVGNPMIQLQMVDRDIIERVAKMWGCNVLGPYGPYQDNKQAYYHAGVWNHKAIAWMFMIYPFMGERRKAKITEIVTKWKTQPSGTVYNAGWFKKERKNAVS